VTPLAESRDRQDITQASGVRARDNLGPTQAIHTAQSHNAIRITKGGLRACPTPLHASEARQLERACLCNLQPGHPPQCHSESASIPSTKMGSPLSSGSTAGVRGIERQTACVRVGRHCMHPRHVSLAHASAEVCRVIEFR
jgi:hypothetical protein